MITKRIIPCLDVKNGRVVKGVNFLGLSDVASPVELAKYYSDCGADELVFYDITASAEGRALFTDILCETAQNVFIPLTVGGGTLDLPGGMQAVCRGGQLRLTMRAAVLPEMTLKPGVNRWGDYDITLRSGAGARVTVRSWRGSDRLTTGRGSRSLKRLFLDAGIPAEDRNRIPVVCVNGAVRAVYGVGIAESISSGENDDHINITIHKREIHKEDTGKW